MYIYKVTAAWTGFNGAPGYSNFYWGDPSEFEGNVPISASDAANEISFFLEGIKSLLPNNVRVTIQSDVPVLEPETGKLQMATTGGNFGPTIGTGGAGAYAAPVGAVVNYRTNGVRNGRRVRGRTFLVPLANTANEADGTLSSAALSTLQTASNNLLTPATARQLVVFARPTTKGGTDGNWFPVQSARISDRVAVLRSRRA